MLPSLGTLKGLGSGLYNMGRGSLFMGASKGATTGGKIMNGLGHAAPLAPAVAGSFKATSNQPGFQPQSTVKTSVSQEWIKQRVQNAVDKGATLTELRSFAENQFAKAKEMDPRLGYPKQRPFTAAEHLARQRFAAGHAAAIAAENATPFVPPNSSDNNLRRYWPLALGGALAAGAYGLYRHSRNSPSEQEAEPKQATLHPVVERALRAKVASGPGLDWHRPVNALSYAAFAAPYLSQTVHDNHKLTTALNAAGLLGLGATSADSIAKGDGLAGYDLAGLGLMGAGLVHGALRPSPTPGAGH